MSRADTKSATFLRQLRGDADSRVRIADFAALPADLSGVFNVPEIALKGTVASGAQLGPKEARQLSDVLKSELVRVCSCI